MKFIMVSVGNGIINANYCGRVKVILYNCGEKDIFFKKGGKIAQLLIQKCHLPQVVETR